MVQKEIHTSRGPRDSKQGTVGSLGVPPVLKLTHVGIPGIPGDSKKGMIGTLGRSLGIPRDSRKGMIGTLGYPRDPREFIGIPKNL